MNIKRWLNRWVKSCNGGHMLGHMEGHMAPVLGKYLKLTVEMTVVPGNCPDIRWSCNCHLRQVWRQKSFSIALVLRTSVLFLLG